MASRVVLVIQITIHLFKYSDFQEIPAAHSRVIYSLIIYDKESSGMKEKVNFIKLISNVTLKNFLGTNNFSSQNYI